MDERQAGHPAGLAGDLGWALRAISLAFQAEADSAVAELPSGARGYLVLLAAEEETERSQLAIARRLGIDKTVMTYLVDALVEQHLVRREPDPADRRVRQLVLTDAGRAAVTAARSRLAAVEDRLLGALPAAGVTRFRADLASVALHASGAGTDCDPR